MSEDDIQRSLGRIEATLAAHVRQSDTYRSHYREEMEGLKDAVGATHDHVVTLTSRVDGIEGQVQAWRRFTLRAPIAAVMFGAGGTGGLVGYWDAIKKSLGGG